MDIAQTLEEVIEELVLVQKDVNKLKTASVSGQELRGRIKNLYKKWLSIAGKLEEKNFLSASTVSEVTDAWSAMVRLANTASPKSQYKPILKFIINQTETDILHKFIKNSAIETVGTALRKLVHGVNNPDLLKYLDESIQCAERNCIRASVVLAWCAVAHKVHEKLKALGVNALNAEFAKMKVDKGLMFRTFSKDYVFSSELDIQEAADAHLILLCRFLLYLDDTQYKHLKNALDLRNGCGHPTGYQPDPVKLQAYYADISQLVLLNPKFT